MVCYIDPKTRVSRGYRTIGGKNRYFRSKWEANYCRYLQWLKENNAIQDWEHEPHTFWFEEIKRGVCSYLPDFRVIDRNGSHYWVEVKGYLDPKSKTKIKRLKKYYPNERLVLIGEKWFKENNKKLRPLVKEWE